MISGKRLVILIVGIPGIFLLAHWISKFVPPMWNFVWMANYISLIFTMIVAWPSWTTSQLFVTNAGLVITSFAFAIVGGFVGLTLGSHGHHFYIFGEFQGNGLGIFVTTPIGFILGWLVGFTYWELKTNRKQ